MNTQLSSARTLEAPPPAGKQYPYYIEKPVTENRVAKFLEAFAAVLEYSDYKPLLDS